MQTTFRVAPLAVLATAAAAAILLGPAWSRQAAAVPWLVALVAVGLPHGAADLAITRRTCGWPATVQLFAVYAALMAAAVVALLLAPRLTVVLFAASSIWHFGLSHAQGQSPPPAAGWPWPAVAALARGAGVLGVPLAAWPDHTSAVIAELFRLLARAGAGPAAAFAPAAIRMAGVGLTLTAILALAVEAWAFRHTPDARRRSTETLVDLFVIGLLGATADPLLSIGLYFLCWHAWREMRPLIAVIAEPVVDSQQAPRLAKLARNVAAVHVAAVPLLIPTWAALAAAWWLLSPGRSPRDLAVLSLAVYVVVTPAHEALHDMLQAHARPCYTLSK